MPRVARTDIANYPYHVLNRAVLRLRLFNSEGDYALFVELLFDTAKETGMRVLAYAIMPNHWHLILYPEVDGDMGLFMHRLTNRHTRLVHARTGTIGTGPLYQGRYKSFMIESDSHLLTVLKYIERNAVRAKLSTLAENWKWGSAWRRIFGSQAQKNQLAKAPVDLPGNYLEWINTPEHSEELVSVRNSVNRGTPYGGTSWVDKTIDQFNLGSTRRGAGRPRLN